jgi:hypothetical protein
MALHIEPRIVRGYLISEQQAAEIQTDPLARSYLHCSDRRSPHPEWLLGYTIIFLDHNHYYSVEKLSVPILNGVEQDIETIADQYQITVPLRNYICIEVNQ